MDKIIELICFDCGKKFLTERQKEGEGHLATFHKGECYMCHEEKMVTDIRHYLFDPIQLISHNTQIKQQ